MVFFNRAVLATFLGFLGVCAIPACGSTEGNGPARGGSSGSAGLGEAGPLEGGGASSKGGSGASDAGSGGSTGGAASSGTSSGGSAGANGGLSGSGGSDSSGDVTDLADAYCTALRSCCQQAGFGSGAQLADCESEYPHVYGLDLVEAGTVLVDRAALDTCLDTLQQLATSCVGLPYNTCQKALKGTRATGEACTDLTECMTGTDPVACMILASDTSGKCQPIPRGTLNATCSGDCFAGGSCSFTSLGGTDPMPAALCFSEDNLFCDTTLDVPKCTSTYAMGAECGSDSQCSADGYCDYDADPMLCKPRKSVGQPCHFSAECSKRDELYCDGSHCALQPFVSDSRCDGTSF